MAIKSVAPTCVNLESSVITTRNMFLTIAVTTTLALQPMIKRHAAAISSVIWAPTRACGEGSGEGSGESDESEESDKSEEGGDEARQPSM